MLTNNNFVVSLARSSGNGQPASASQFSLVQVKQEPVDGNPGASQDSTQEHSLDLSKKDHRYTTGEGAMFTHLIYSQNKSTRKHCMFSDP